MNVPMVVPEWAAAAEGGLMVPGRGL